MQAIGKRVVAIVQARMGSTRLPGKVLRDVGGKPMLVRVVERTRRAKLVDEVVVATTDEPLDDLIAACCNDKGWCVFRGNGQDVLDRYYQTAQEHEADIVVRITADCPLVDPRLVDEVVGSLCHQQGADYLSCIVPPRRFPRGLDTEAFTYEALERAWCEALDPGHREHVTLYMLQNPDKFVVHGYTSRSDYSFYRWTVDEEADLELVDKIFRYFGHDHFRWQQVVAACEQNPAWLGINAHVRQKAA